MKRCLFSIALAVIFALPLCACGKSGPHPLSVDFQTEDDLVLALETFFRSDWGGTTDEDFSAALNNLRTVAGK